MTDGVNDGNYWRLSVTDELAQNDKLQLEDVATVREWLQKQSDFPQDIPDNQIILFLYAGGYRIQETKVLIENYYNLRTKLTQFFSQRNPLHPFIQDIISVTACIIHGKDNMNRSVLWTKLLNTDSNKYYPTTATKVMFMISDVDQLENGAGSGCTMVLDGKNFSVKHAMRCSFTNARNIINYVQTASTVVIEKVFLINMTPAAEKVMMLLKPFIYSSLFKKITICPSGNYEEMYKVIPKESIPNDYDGYGPSIESLNEIWRNKLESYKDWFVEEEKQRLRDPKKIGQSAENDNDQVIEESFKSLAID